MSGSAAGSWSSTQPATAPIVAGSSAGGPAAGSGTSKNSTTTRPTSPAAPVGVGRRDLVGAAQPGGELARQVEAEVAGPVELAADGPVGEVGGVHVHVVLARAGGELPGQVAV